MAQRWWTEAPGGSLASTSSNSTWHALKERLLRHSRFFILALCAFSTLILFPVSSEAQGGPDYAVALLIGFGGSAESEPDTGIDNFSLEGLFSYKIDRSTLFRARVGQLDLETDFGSSELSYLTLGGEYLIPTANYTSGLFLGLGFYDVTDGGGFVDDTALGLTMGVTGDFKLNDRFSVLVELSGHYADLDSSQFFAAGHVGLVFHF